VKFSAPSRDGEKKLLEDSSDSKFRDVHTVRTVADNRAYYFHRAAPRDRAVDHH